MKLLANEYTLGYINIIYMKIGPVFGTFTTVKHFILQVIVGVKTSFTKDVMKRYAAIGSPTRQGWYMYSLCPACLYAAWESNPGVLYNNMLI